MDIKINDAIEQPAELAVASAATLGNWGIYPEKEFTMLDHGISED